MTSDPHRKITRRYPSRFCPWCGSPTGKTPPEGRCPACDQSLADHRVGSVIAERYRIDTLLAEGGMGRVYRATHLELGEPVVIKFLLGDWAVRPEARARMRREAVLLMRLRHPGVVSVHDFGEQSGSPYIVMDLVEGQTLRELGAGRPLQPARVAPVFDQVLAVLEVAHAQGITHRDLKPENVMIQPSGHIKVLDFGMAIQASGDQSERLTTPGAIQGTPLYMSPEQCQGHEVGPASDLYSLGVMLYEALCGETPFAGGSTAELMARHLFAPPPTFAERAGVEVPPGLEALVLRALAKKPEDRVTAGEMRRLLGEAAAGRDQPTQAARDKRQVGGLSREQRALPKPAQSTGSRSGPVAAIGPEPVVAMWSLPMVRAVELRDILAVNGIRVVVEDEPDEVVSAAVLAWDERTLERLRALRRHPTFHALPVLVVDVPEAGILPSLIRAGASDAALASTADGILSRRVWRLIRRKR